MYWLPKFEIDPTNSALLPVRKQISWAISRVTRSPGERPMSRMVSFILLAGCGVRVTKSTLGTTVNGRQVNATLEGTGDITTKGESTQVTFPGGSKEGCISSIVQ